VARAKRTDRADARRRYRQMPIEELDDTSVDTPPPSASRRAPSAPSAPQGRPSITSALRRAYHPPQIREDLAALPWLLRTPAFYVPAILVVAGTVATSAFPANQIAGLVFQAMVVPPAMAPIFIAGFFARRASYLLGLLIAVIDVAAYAAFIYLVAPAMAVTPIDPAQQQSYVFSAITVGPVSGIFFAAAAAWYRRFLALSNSGAAQRAKARQQQRSRSGKPARG
jgi:hypothetical protein